MGTLKITARCQVSGPLGDGTAIKAAEQWAEKTSQALADEGVAMLRAWPFTGGKAGEGRDSKGRFTHREDASRSRGGFQSALKVVRVSSTETRVPGPQQRGVVWAPWLEGTSKRNTSTGFKGYGMFRKTRTELNKKAPAIGQKVLDDLLPEMGGE